MRVSEALFSRSSVRGFLDRPVSLAVLRRVLEAASRAPSGGNVQPWNSVVLSGEPLAGLKHAMAQAISEGRRETAEYQIYPENLPEPYRTRRFQTGEGLYGLLGIPRENKAQRAQWFSINYQFFGAPVGLFLHTPRYMGPPQWADLGIWLQSVMLMLREEGLDSCPQEAWVLWPETVRRFAPIAADHIIYTGMAIGYRDAEAPANRLIVPRASIDETTKFLGFEGP